jgi:signal transduction histidine kinase/streptogramin lyase
MAEGRRNQLDAYYALIPYDSNSVLMPSGVQMGMDAEGRTYLDRKREDLNEQYTIARDKNGFFWIRDGKGSLHQCDRELNYMRSWAVKLNTKVLFVDSSNTLWIGTEKRGLIAMDLNDFDPKPVRMFPAPNIGCITADKHAQVIWFGGAKGLYRLDKRSRKVDEFHALKNKSVRSLYAVSEQEVWITTYEDGIYLYLDGRIIALPHDRENLLSSAHCMIRDAEDQFWITTNKGLFIALRNDLLEYARGMRAAVYYHYYSKEKGFNTNEFNGGCEPCGTLLANGNILFPSLDGIVCALPQKVEKDFPTGPLMADRVEIDNQWISFTGDTLRLPTRFDVLKLHFAMLYFGNKKNIQLTYSLLKAGQSSSEWYPVSADNVISFSTLASGTYKLHIRKMNGFGKDNFSERVITIIIPERFFETTWFKILVLAGMLLLVYAYFRIRVLYIIKSNRMLELRIARRTRKLMSTLRALESSEQSLRQQTQIQEMLIAAISHDIKSPMKYLLLTSKKMQQFIQKKEYEAIPVFNEGIRETAEHVYGILDNLLKYITIQLKQGTVKPEHLDLRALITEKAETFKNIAANNNTVIENNVAPQSSIYCNRDLLAVVVHNLLDNAVKYTANGSISVNYYARERMLAIDDTGTGIGEELQHWINSPMDDQKVRVDTASGHKGMGLIIVKELLKALGATIKVGTRDSGGTWVHILFSEQHYEGII